MVRVIIVVLAVLVAACTPTGSVKPERSLELKSLKPLKSLEEKPLKVTPSPRPVGLDVDLPITDPLCGSMQVLHAVGEWAFNTPPAEMAAAVNQLDMTSLLYVGAIGLGSLLWVTWLTRCADVLFTFARTRPNVWLYDWNVYHAAAGDLLTGELYRNRLVEPGHQLPIGVFNYPPLAALVAVPLLPLGREGGGIAFVIASSAAVAGGAALALRAAAISRWWLWAPAILTAYLLAWPPTRADIGLANNNALMFLLVAGFALAHVHQRERWAGILLALAVGIKLWPIALVVLLLRERRWVTVRWMLGVLAIQGILFLAWLGPDVLPDLTHALLQNTPRDTSVAVVLWTSAFREWWDWWPAWGTYAVAVGLLLIPARGRLGLGIGIIAGLSLNANLWHHYLWAFGLGGLLIAFWRLERRELQVTACLDRRQSRGLRGMAQGERAGVDAIPEDAREDRHRVRAARSGGRNDDRRVVSDD